MSFNSLYFILFFLPLTLAAYYLAGRRSRIAADWILVGASVIFYGFSNLWYPVMLGALIALNWGLTLMIRRAGSEGSCAEEVSQAAKTHAAAASSARTGMSAKGWMICGVVLNVGFLAFFKYTNFFLENLNAVFGSDWVLENLILPLGISFIIFSQISWIVDSYRGSTADVCFREYVLYSSFFPKLSQGPITLMRDFLPQLRRKDRLQPDYDALSVGIQMFVFGLGKKILIADVLGTAVESYFDTMVFMTNVDSLAVMLAYTFQIYFDFSGYSDMALGVSKMLGFHLPANFNSPYKSCTITEFWRRWHISLTTFLREYIYFPLGGSRSGTIRTYRNIMIVYLVSGIWHGASWGYVLWGVFHGLAQAAERLFGKWYLKVWKPVRWFITFGVVNVLWMLFRCGDWSTFTRFWWHLASEKSGTLSPGFAANFRIVGLRFLCSLVNLPTGDVFVNTLSLVLMLLICFVICLCLPNNQDRTYRNNTAVLLVTAAVLMVCLLSMSKTSVFVYNDF